MRDVSVGSLPADRQSRLFSPSAVVLILVNLIPLIGVWKFGWSVGEILLLYWAETFIMGVLNIPKILTARGGRGGDGKAVPGQQASLGGRLYLTLFFMVHFGMFSAGHVFFVYEIFKPPPPNTGLLIALAGLSASHFYSLVVNWFGKAEYLGKTPNEQMGAPYLRVIVLHVVVIAGGALVDQNGSAIWALALLIGLKTVIDLTAHALSHRRVNKQAAA